MGVKQTPISGSYQAGLNDEQLNINLAAKRQGILGMAMALSSLAKICFFAN